MYIPGNLDFVELTSDVDILMSGGIAGIAPGSSFEANPLGWLDSAAAVGRGIGWISPNQLCVFDAEAARRLLRNEDGFLLQHSDFFGPIDGALAPRAAQVALARECLALVQRHARGLDYAAHADSLGARSPWPGAGNRMMLAMMRPVLASPDRSPAIHAALDFILEDRIANRHGPQRRRWFRLFRQFQLARAILKQTTATERRGDPADILDVIARAQGGMRDEGLVHLYLAFVFALAGSVGFALGWALLLAVQSGRTAAPPADMLREALRLYPVAWLLGRTPLREAEILGERVSPSDEVVVSPYGNPPQSRLLAGAGRLPPGALAGQDRPPGVAAVRSWAAELRRGLLLDRRRRRGAGRDPPPPGVDRGRGRTAVGARGAGLARLHPGSRS